MAKGWKSVDLPEHLHRQLQRILDHGDAPDHFQSMAQIVRDAVTEYLLRWYTFAALLAYNPKPAQCKACHEEVRLIPLEQGGRITFVEWGHLATCRHHRASPEQVREAAHRKREAVPDWDKFFAKRTDLSRLTDAIQSIDRDAAKAAGRERISRKDRRRDDSST